MQRVTLKTSTIFIAKGNRTRVYHSVGEIPQGLRKELEASTNGFNSATILIADKRGREEVRRALKGMPSAFRTRFAPPLDALPAEKAAVPPVVMPQVLLPPASLLQRVRAVTEAHWMKVVIPVGFALATWAALSLRP